MRLGTWNGVSADVAAKWRHSTPAKTTGEARNVAESINLQEWLNRHDNAIDLAQFQECGRTGL